MLFNITLTEWLQIGIFLLLFIFLVAMIYFLITHQRVRHFKKPTAKDFTMISGENSAATRLDLARAYIEMQQFEQARVLLNQVAKMSDQIAKAEAEQLLQEIGQ